MASDFSTSSRLPARIYAVVKIPKAIIIEDEPAKDSAPAAEGKA